MSATKNKKYNKPLVLERIITWLFYVELVIAGLALLSRLAGDATYGIELIIIPTFSILITVLSLFIVTKLKHSSILIRIAIALNWIVILLLIWNVTD